eukprot:scaffold30799_cov50-Attheya_sp.AAC.5
MSSMVPLTVGSCKLIKLRTEFRCSSRSSRRLVPACVVGFSAALGAPKETREGEVALRKMVMSGVCRVVLAGLLDAFGLTVVDVALIFGFYTLGGGSRRDTIQWTEIHTAAFNAMKALMAKDCLLSYPDPNIPYDIETDASDYQIGSVIKQNGWPVAYFLRKLREAQLNYTTIEKETLSIVECLQEFHSMHMGPFNNLY